MHELLLTDEKSEGVNGSDIIVAFFQIDYFMFQLLAEVIPRTL